MPATAFWSIGWVASTSTITRSSPASPDAASSRCRSQLSSDALIFRTYALSVQSLGSRCLIAVISESVCPAGIAHPSTVANVTGFADERLECLARFFNCHSSWLSPVEQPNIPLVSAWAFAAQTSKQDNGSTRMSISNESREGYRNAWDCAFRRVADGY